MNLPVVLRPEAQEDLLRARDWYQRQRAGLGDEFIDALEQFLGRVQNSPEMYAAAYKEVRRGKLRRFPYVVYYRVLDERIEILAILHGGRNPRAWQSRT